MNRLMAEQVDHGGGIDAARARFGGAREDWIDLSTGINPLPYPLPDLPGTAWTTLPDDDAHSALMEAARTFWNVPDQAAILAAPGTSALIARIPSLLPAERVFIPGPTYNEHARAFRAAGWVVSEDDDAEALVAVHPNNPDGRLWRNVDARPLTVIDESFADTAPDQSLIGLTTRPGTLILKGLGKFWGLAGLRLGFVIGDPSMIAHLSTMLGPWPVSGPALAIGAAALTDAAWASATRTRLARDCARLDAMMTGAGATLVGGTALFRLFDTPDATRWQESLARHRIWTRVFPYSHRWMRLGLPDRADHWQRLTIALEDMK
ncbi:threonine-phosphate decarboxylase CobD [Tabrizicola sp. J26]|uniref:threonine-phosphate decarboxylase CobD n=1 Tax=Alitabrizicola rongguiensis TaxID=2909234 RepID=UPI001F02D7BC|nr:threonine-phosphate decarboxylase CobD [Tabrizicola rongguiensis]MCF1708062.1 threonine-phosphate decarboxylase CobD [Tabrizicola rongguiensis]